MKANYSIRINGDGSAEDIIKSLKEIISCMELMGEQQQYTTADGTLYCEIKEP